MSMRRSTSFTLCTLALGLVSQTASASNYPPDYPVCSARETKYTGPFEIIRELVDPYDDHAKLTVAYDGYLRDLYPDDQINIYLSLNGNDAMFEASAGTNDDAYIFLDSGPRGCTWCGNGYNPTPSICDSIVWGPYDSGKWMCGQPSAIEEHIFFWGFGDGYADVNAWDIEVAAEANGQWDSNYGENFYARFDSRNGCY